ncbi:hypothetical protein AAFC00_005331 [Neodothiora populina]|uniref:Inclusion body clearance protein IML2 n=1 Tax=Neodothiora populina TaxID=2781224 RepID=A0ABR3PKK3_9PEZI
MKRVGGWLGASKNASTQSLTALDEPKALEDALASVLHILNDDVETADTLLSKGNSPFHKLGKGTVAFIRATLGFEPEVMKQAAEALSAAEDSAYQSQRVAHRHAHKSNIYPAGSEYAVCQAEAQLMGAVVAVLSESLSESLRGFYKLRKAYVTLQAIADAEKRYLRTRSSMSVAGNSVNSSRLSLASTSSMKKPPMVADDREKSDTKASSDDEEMDFEDANEDLDSSTPASYQGHLESEKLASKLDNLDLKSDESEGATVQSAELEDAVFDELTQHPIDLFIHSSMNLSFGILQLLLSMVPPAFSKLLYVVGFKGDRDEGLAMLWRAIRHAEINGINGAMAGLVTLGYYNGMVGFCDIVSQSAYPEQRLRALLARMRSRFPQSRLWLLEEARLLAGDKKLESALEVGDPRKNKSPLKQVEALQWFERSLNSMYLHRYQDCADAFLTCVKLNNWSHGLYFYIAGCCHVQMYRENKITNPPQAKKHAEEATKLLRSVPSHAGKKRLMAKQLPFDAFVTRKIAKWEARATELHLPFVDAVGVAPVEEMIYFWNGYKRMRPEDLEHSLAVLHEATTTTTTKSESFDEQAILSFLRAVTTSRLSRTAEAKEILRTQLLSHEWAEIRGGHRDNWTLPVAHYEMAVNLWVESGGERASKPDLVVCSEWLEKAARWDSYDLDARVGLKITTARNTLRKCGIDNGSA